MKRKEFVREVVRRMAEVPGVASVAVTSDLPASGAGNVTVRIKDEVDLQKSALDFVVTPDYFDVSEIPLLSGRIVCGNG